MTITRRYKIFGGIMQGVYSSLVENLNKKQIKEIDEDNCFGRFAIEGAQVTVSYMPTQKHIEISGKSIVRAKSILETLAGIKLIPLTK